MQFDVLVLLGKRGVVLDVFQSDEGLLWMGKIKYMWGGMYSILSSLTAALK